jgi:hypothetical protein
LFAQCYNYDNDGFLPRSYLEEMLARFSNTQPRAEPGTGLPLEWSNCPAEQWRGLVAFFDPLDSGLVDWRELLLSLTLPKFISTPTGSELAELLAALKAADEDQDGKLTLAQFESVTLWLENQLPEDWKETVASGKVEEPVEIKEDGDSETLMIDTPPLTKLQQLKQNLFRLFSSKSVWPSMEKPVEPVEDGEEQDDVPTVHERDLMNETIGIDGLLNIRSFLIYLAFDDDIATGTDKVANLGLGATDDEDTKDLLSRVESTQRSKFSRKNV